MAAVVAIGVLSAAVGPAGRPAPTRSPSAAAGQGAKSPSAEAPAPGDFANVSPGTAPLTRGALARVPDPVARGAPPAPVPEVVRFRPRNGWADVSPGADLSVRFTTAMNHASTEAAFSATTLGSAAIAGTVRWAEGSTVLVLNPRTSLAAGARIQLQVSAGALSAEGIPIAAPSSVTFTVAAAAPAPPKAPASVAAATGWRWPLIGPITQYFGQSLTVYGFHQGIDIDGDTGDPVRAAHSGRVVVAGHYDDCGGLEVHIDHGDGITTWYRHLSRIDVAVGATVGAGSVIGLVGETGCAFGSHLHFGVRLGSTFVDPLRYLPPR